MNLPKIASISKKITIALIGLFLLLFLVVHLGINLCLLRSDGGKWYVDASNFMGTNYIVKIFEVVLFAAIIVHIILTVALQIKNWKARPVVYHQKQKSKTSVMSKYMIYTGLLIFAFLLLHFSNFYCVKMGIVEGKYMVKTEDVLTEDFIEDYALYQKGMLSETKAKKVYERATFMENLDKTKVFDNGKWIRNLTPAEIAPFKDDIKLKPDFYNMAADLFQKPLYSILYIIFFVILGFHMVHAFQSACQTLGLNHNKYNRFIEVFSWTYAICITLGFTIIPVYFLFFY